MIWTKEKARKVFTFCFPKSRPKFARLGNTWLGGENEFFLRSITIDAANNDSGMNLIHFTVRDGVHYRVAASFSSIEDAERFVSEFLTRIGACEL